MEKVVTPFTINEYLDLGQRIWHIEFALSDFKTENIAKLLNIPTSIYNTNPKTNFWAFLKVFLRECEIAFINRRYPKGIGISRENEEIALLGYWENKEMAIPLWIIDDLLLGFEVISDEEYQVLSSEPLNWVYPLTHEDISFIAGNGVVSLDEDIYRNRKIFFELKRTFISLSAFNELEIFERIANVDLPEVDDFGNAF
ncbi:MAG: hypothetical protein ACXADY_25940 [Candidatus Hodarchaeales archaeon]